jgi:site-specific recombinase XerD
MTLSTGKRRYHHKKLTPADPKVKPWHTWTADNQAFFDSFRAWLQGGGYALSTINTYCTAVRLGLGFLNKPWRKIEPGIDLPYLIGFLKSKALKPDTRRLYRRGLVKLAVFLDMHRQTSPRKKPRPPIRGIRSVTEDPINWAYYCANLPDWLVEDIHAYLRLHLKDWRGERQHRASCETISQLTTILRWIAKHTELGSIEAITPEVWARYTQARHRSGIVVETLNLDLRRLHSFLRFLEQEGRPICQRMKFVIGLPVEPHIARDAPVEQIRSLLAEIEIVAHSTEPTLRRSGLMDRAWFLLMLYGGLRTAEVRFLRLDDVDWEHQRVRIEQSKGFRERLVYLSEEALDALQAYLEVRGLEGKDHKGWIFLYRHNLLSSRYCQQRLHTYGRRCHIKISPHQLRYTCATLMLNSGVPIATVQAILGHKHIDTTLSYARLYNDTVMMDYKHAIGQ